MQKQPCLCGIGRGKGIFLRNMPMVPRKICAGQDEELRHSCRMQRWNVHIGAAGHPIMIRSGCSPWRPVLGRVRRPLPHVKTLSSRLSLY